MTKEELKKEAEDWIVKNSKEFITNPNYSPFDYAEAIYIASAEPREKRIEELEYQLTHRNCLDCSNHSSKLRMRNLELEKENAELRKTETMLKILKDRGVIKSWYYNGSYHIGNELPR